MGPDIQPEDIQELFNQLDDLTEKDILVISGSIPSTLPDTMYETNHGACSRKRK